MYVLYGRSHSSYMKPKRGWGLGIVVYLSLSSSKGYISHIFHVRSFRRRQYIYAVSIGILIGIDSNQPILNGMINPIQDVAARFRTYLVGSASYFKKKQKSPRARIDTVWSTKSKMSGNVSEHTLWGLYRILRKTKSRHARIDSRSIRYIFFYLPVSQSKIPR